MERVAPVLQDREACVTRVRLPLRNMRDESSSIQLVYSRLAPVYDLVYGIGLQHGRRRAMERLAPVAGEAVLEIGVGTGLSAMNYPAGCRVAAIDVSAEMMARARARLARRGVCHVALCRMDAACLAFPDASFDAVYAAYVINVVPDPIQVTREMIRVCRPGGRVVLLNHFRETTSGPGHRVARWLGQVAVRAGGVNWDVDLRALLRQTGLTALSIDQVNVPRVSSVVLCRRP
jgi:phosphatidylethanolamine/phosphatidyl-N-methylethanolamine N-methyltransferase